MGAGGEGERLCQPLLLAGISAASDAAVTVAVGRDPWHAHLMVTESSSRSMGLQFDQMSSKKLAAAAAGAGGAA